MKPSERIKEIASTGVALCALAGVKTDDAAFAIQAIGAYLDEQAESGEAARLRTELDAAKREIAVDDQLLADRQRILDACPCPVHGSCIPYVLEQIARLKAGQPCTGDYCVAVEPEKATR